jgi:pimeloyl-ACP methyl ester carboxylesterase
VKNTQETDIMIDGVKLHVLRTNNFPDRPTIIFLHESFGCIELWKDFPIMLGEKTKCNILIYDRQGYGKSDPFSVKKRTNDYLEKEADILYKILKHLEIKNAILFGHSDGANISLITASRYPENILAVISEAAHLFVEDITRKGINDAIDKYEHSDLKQKLEKYHSGKTDALFYAWADIWLSESFVKWNMEHFLPNIKCPVLVIQGTEDEYGSMEQVNSVVNNVKSYVSQLIIQGTGHSPHLKAKELVLNEVSCFIINTL